MTSGERTESEVISGPVVEAIGLVAECDALIAQTAMGAAARIEEALSNPDIILDDDARHILTQSLGRLTLTSDTHLASVPWGTSTRVDSIDMLKTVPCGLVDALGATFVSSAEQVGRKSDEDLLDEIENMERLLSEIRGVGASIRNSAMDKAPSDMGLFRNRVKTVTWEAHDENLLGSEYRFVAQYKNIEGKPSLASISCSYVADVDAEKSASEKYTSSMYPETHPVTVSASFDGSDMTSMELYWPHPAIMPRNRRWSRSDQLGPAWQNILSNGDGKILKSLLSIAEAGSSKPPVSTEKVRPIAGTTEGKIEINFCGTPSIITSRLLVGDYIKRSGKRTFAGLINSFRVYGPQTVFEYSESRDEFLEVGMNGESLDFSSNEIIRLSRDLGHFFPVLHLDKSIC